MIRRVALFTVTVAFVTAGGCGSGTNQYPFRDQKGRHCVRTCTGNDCTFSCDTASTPSVACSATACFTVAYENLAAPAPSSPVLALCDSCCFDAGDAGPVSAWLPQDCSAVVCTQDIDCAVGGAHCQAGYCQQQ